MRLSYKNEEARDSFLLLAPLFLLLALFIAFPVLSNFRFAFLDWKGFGTPKPVGLANFAAMFSSPMFRISLLNTGKLLLYIPVSVASTVLLAALLVERGQSVRQALADAGALVVGLGAGEVGGGLLALFLLLCLAVLFGQAPILLPEPQLQRTIGRGALAGAGQILIEALEVVD